MNPIGLILLLAIFFILVVSGVAAIFRFIWKKKGHKACLWISRILFWPCFVLFLVVFGYCVFYIVRAKMNLYPYREHVSEQELVISCDGTSSAGTFSSSFISQDDFVLEEVESFDKTGNGKVRTGARLEAKRPGNAVAVLIEYGGGGTLDAVYIYDIEVDESMEIRYEKQEFNPGWDDRLAVAEQVKQLLIKNYGCTPEEVEVIGDMEWNTN